MNVLLVDDEEKFVSRLAERLTMRGVDTDWVTSGQAAIEKAAAKMYDIAILDVKMPLMGGLELKKRLEAVQPHLKFILVTGHGSGEDYEIGCREAFCYIIKPFNIDFLMDRINEVSKLKQSES
ncbi:MAG: response regulator [Desulfosarcinaceae bacterium]